MRNMVEAVTSVSARKRVLNCDCWEDVFVKMKCGEEAMEMVPWWSWNGTK